MEPRVNVTKKQFLNFRDIFLVPLFPICPSGVSLKMALVYDGELAPSVEADAYFDALVPARRLLGF